MASSIPANLLHLPKTLLAWDTPEFRTVLQREFGQLGSKYPPLQTALQQALQHSSIALHDEIQVILLTSSADQDSIQVQAGIFYSGLIAGCNCADDPSSAEDKKNEYCEIRLKIERFDARCQIQLTHS